MQLRTKLEQKLGFLERMVGTILDKQGIQGQPQLMKAQICSRSTVVARTKKDIVCLQSSSDFCWEEKVVTRYHFSHPCQINEDCCQIPRSQKNHYQLYPDLTYIIMSHFIQSAANSAQDVCARTAR